MRPRFIMAICLIAPCLSASADTMVDYSIQGYGSVYVPTSPRRGHTLQDTTTGTAIFDVDTQMFTKFEFSAYEGTTDYPGTMLNGDPCTPDALYWCLSVAGDPTDGMTFDLYDQEYMVYFKRGYSRVEEQYYGSLTPVSSTPEPYSFVLLGTGLLGAAGALKRRFSKS